ncbi:MAG: IS110 family transposase [Verrucomicrobiae bacterium]|jgi:transposase|nr:IS110 family transposase [Verrucomicrobiae bacterium]
MSEQIKSSYELVIGLDRSDRKADLHYLDTRDGRQWSATIGTSPEALDAWLAQLRDEHPDTAIGLIVEQPAAAILTFLQGRPGLAIHAINPVTLQKFREAFVVSRAKDDAKDAFYLAQLLAHHAERLPRWQPEDGATAVLGQMVLDRRMLIDERTSLTNRLKDLLKRHFPQALQLCGDDLWRPLALDFLGRWPTLAQVQAARPQTLRSFYHSHGSRSQRLLDQRLQTISGAVDLVADQALLHSYKICLQCIVAQLRVLNRSLAQFDKEISAAFAGHADHAIYDSFPGAGPTLAPRLLVGMGSQRERFANAADLQQASGIAPVTKQSGRSHLVHRRYLCSRFLRQTFHEYANQSILHCRWAAAYYLQQRRKGAQHHTAVRALAFKWQRVIFRCWQDHLPYDDQAFEASLQKRNSPLYQLLNNIEVGKNPFTQEQNKIQKPLAGSPQR